MGKRGKLTRENVTQLLHKSEGFYRDSSTLDFNDSGKIDHLSEISDYESLDDILGELYRIQKLMNEQYISKNTAFLIHLVIQQQEFHHTIFYDKNPNHFVKKMCDSIFSSFMPFVHRNLPDSK